MKDATMKKPRSEKDRVEVEAEYDFAGGVRGKYVDRCRLGTNVVLLDPELMEAFPDSKSVNAALKALMAIASQANLAKRS